jgi:hypothetical protein
MMHVRAKTKGAETKQENNHPVSGLGWLVTHNGVITNDDEVWEELKGDTERFAEVDSSAINLVLSRRGLSGLGLLSGGASLVAWNSQSRNQLVLAKIGTNPFWLFMPSPGLLVWSSDPDVASVMYSSLVGQVPMCTAGQLPEGTALTVSLSGEIKTYKIKSKPIPMKPRSHVLGYNPLPTHYAGPPTSWTPPAQGVQVRDSRPFGGSISAGSDSDRGVKSTGLQSVKRPAPMYDNVQIPSPGLLRCLESVGRTGSVIVKTVYGKWLVNENKNVGYTMQFIPNRDMKRWAVNESFDWWEAMEDEEIRALLSNRQPLEIREGKPVNAMFCPWCGISRSQAAWMEDKLQCEYCEITSLHHIVTQ